MITTPEIICDLFSFLNKDQIERIQLVNQFWNSVIIRHNNILPLRKFKRLDCYQIHLYATERIIASYIIKFDGISLSKITNRYVSSRYSQMTVDEVLTNLHNGVYENIEVDNINSEGLDDLLNMMKLVTTKTGCRLRGRNGKWYRGRFYSKLAEIIDNYIIVDKLTIGPDSYTREVCANPEIVQLPSTPKDIRLSPLEFKENEKVLNFTCNGKLNGANRLTIEFVASDYGNFIRQWFELYRTHQNTISLVGKFAIFYDFDIALNALKTFLINTQLRVKYSLETKEFHNSFYSFIKQYVKRSCVLHETDSYALVIEMEYGQVTDMSSINASDLDQPPCDQIRKISFCVSWIG